MEQQTSPRIVRKEGTWEMAVQLKEPAVDGHRCSTGSVMVVTTEGVAGWHIRATKGQVLGLVVRSSGLGADIMAGLGSLNDRTADAYAELLEDARQQAIRRMSENAEALGANAVVGMHFDSSDIADVMTEIVAYGTGVVIEPD